MSMISSVFGLLESRRIGLASHKSTRPFPVCATASINSKFGSSHRAPVVAWESNHLALPQKSVEFFPAEKQVAQRAITAAADRAASVGALSEC